MKTLQLFGWLFILFCAGVLLLWVRLSYARTKAAQAAPEPHKPFGPADRACVHEAGHIVAQWFDPHTTEIVGAVVFDDGNGFVGTRKHNPPDYARASFLWHYVCNHLAGIAAEIHVYGKAGTKGSEDDLVQARDAVVAYLAGDRGAMNVSPWPEPPPDHATSKSISRFYETPLAPEVARVIDLGYLHAKSLIAAHQERLHTLAHALKAKRSLSSAQIAAIMDPRPGA